MSSDVEALAAAEQLEILRLTANLGMQVDARDWGAVEGLFTDSVEVDYTSLNGGDPQTVNSSAMVAGWRDVLDRLDATQHLIAGQVITLDGDRASCAANVQATHVLDGAAGGPLWTVAGRYDFGLARTPRGWRINALTLTVAWSTGNPELLNPGSGGG